jgi:serine protease Do
MLPTSKSRLLAVSLIALLLLGGTVAGIALRSDRTNATVAANLSPAATRAAVERATSLSDAFIAISAAVTPAVVRIEVERRAYGREQPALSGQLRDLFGRAGSDEPQSIPQLGAGSGFIVSAEGYILTNNHVIADADRITVILRDNRVFDAMVIGTDPATDIAVIRIDAPGLSSVRFGDSDQARVGEWVLAIGNPGFADESTLDFTVTTGIISAKNRPLDILNAELPQTPEGAVTAIEDFIQTDAVINPGNSGGPLVDLQGNVIGVNTAIASTTGYSQGYGFAIPANLAQRVMRDLIDHGYVHRALLGISIKDVAAEDAEVYRLPRIAGVVVEDFAEGSPAPGSGLRRHDVIVEVDGRPVQRVGELQRLIALHHPGDVVPLAVIRYGERTEVRVRLMEAAGTGRPEQKEPAPVARELGIQVEELTAVLARQLGYAKAGGAIISRVAPASPADRKEIVVGQRIVSINGDTIDSLAKAQTVLEQIRSGQIVSMLLEEPGGRTYIANVRKP